MYFQALKVRVRKAGVKNSAQERENGKFYPNSKRKIELLWNFDATPFANTAGSVSHPATRRASALTNNLSLCLPEQAQVRVSG